ncbi:pYEATS domain-containing protein [Undibacterium sp. JH2W]|uniref:pYEATS domain-containing protein n=1 Tax=Undibacterium sp. JH2W TaxID=3413037 RepID=UPI003BEFD196
MADTSTNTALTVKDTKEQPHSVVADILGAVAWPLFALFLLFLIRRELRVLLRTLSDRLRSGAAVKMGAFEVGAVNINHIDLANPSSESRKDDGRRMTDRDGYYQNCRNVLLVHRIAKSRTEGQEFDILVYVIPHEDKGTLAAISKVDYFFGRFWKNTIFTSTNRYAGFPVRLCAYGPTLCSAEIHFTDGHSVILHRYLDFEMGGSAPLTADEVAAK